jgi:hypothetical protein
MSQLRRIAKEIQLENSRTLGPVFFHGPLMLPFLRDGDLIVVEPVSFDGVRTGDIITYREAEKFPTSRVIRKSAGKLWLKGDNFPVVREVAPDDVLARVVERQRDRQRLTRGSLYWRLHTQFILFRQWVRG